MVLRKNSDYKETMNKTGIEGPKKNYGPKGTASTKVPSSKSAYHFPIMPSNWKFVSGLVH